MAECLPEEKEGLSECRHTKYGDDWCKKNRINKPYSYNHKCLLRKGILKKNDNNISKASKYLIYTKKDMNCTFANEIMICRDNKENSLINGTAELHSSNGILQARIKLKNGKQNGITEEYSQDGKLKSKAMMKNGKKEGVVETYYPNGNIHFKVFSKNNKMNGISSTFYKNGKLENQVNMKNNKKNGIQKIFTKDGSLLAEIPWVNNKKNGVVKGYYSSGTLMAKDTWKNDVLIKHVKYPDLGMKKNVVGTLEKQCILENNLSACNKSAKYYLSIKKFNKADIYSSKACDRDAIPPKKIYQESCIIASEIARLKFKQFQLRFKDH